MHEVAADWWWMIWYDMIWYACIVQWCSKDPVKDIQGQLDIFDMIWYNMHALCNVVLRSLFQTFKVNLISSMIYCAIPEMFILHTRWTKIFIWNWLCFQRSSALNVSIVLQYLLPGLIPIHLWGYGILHTAHQLWGGHDSTVPRSNISDSFGFTYFVTHTQYRDIT
jgi:hypothetical protein